MQLRVVGRGAPQWHCGLHAATTQPCFSPSARYTATQSSSRGSRLGTEWRGSCSLLQLHLCMRAGKGPVGSDVQIRQNLAIGRFLPSMVICKAARF